MTVGTRLCVPLWGTRYILLAFLLGAFSETGLHGAIGKALNTIGCGRQSPLFPANSPYIVAVGGLTWENNNPDDVVAWSCVPGSEGGTGGGFSNVWAAPPFQKTLVDAYFAQAENAPGFAVGYNRTGRAYPDISAFMDGVPLCFNGQCHDSIVGGTSASTPTVAGIFSLLNDHRLNHGSCTLFCFVGCKRRACTKCLASNKR